MQFHKALITLNDNISKLQFSTQHDMKRSPTTDDESTFDVITRTSCNKMFTEEFEQHISSVVDDILYESKELLSKLGTHYQREILDIVVHTDRILNYYFTNNQYKGIEETVQGFDLFNNEMYQLGMMDYDKIETRTEPKEEFYLILITQIERLKSELSELLFNEKEEVKPITKLEWNTSADNLGLLLIELCKKGWIEIPRSKGEPSMRKLSFVCSDIFDFNGSKGPKTGTQRSLENVVTGQTLQSEIKTKLLDIPSPDQL